MNRAKLEKRKKHSDSMRKSTLTKHKLKEINKAKRLEQDELYKKLGGMNKSFKSMTTEQRELILKKMEEADRIPHKNREFFLYAIGYNLKSGTLPPSPVIAKLISDYIHFGAYKKLDIVLSSYGYKLRNDISQAIKNDEIDPRLLQIIHSIGLNPERHIYSKKQKGMTIASYMEQTLSSPLVAIKSKDKVDIVQDVSISAPSTTKRSNDRFLTPLQVDQLLSTGTKNSIKAVLKDRSLIITQADQERLTHALIGNSAKKNTIKIVSGDHKVRTGQVSFRKLVLSNYSECVFTGTPVLAVLEAAHIIPANGNNDSACNGLLLRADRFLTTASLAR